MTDQPVDLTDVEAMTEEQRNAIEIEKAAKRQQFGQLGDRVDTSLGNMGGAGASGAGPDISHQSEPTPGNSSDLASR